MKTLNLEVDENLQDFVTVMPNDVAKALLYTVLRSSPTFQEYATDLIFEESMLLEVVAELDVRLVAVMDRDEADVATIMRRLSKFQT